MTEVHLSTFSKTILTHQLVPMGPLPPVLDPDGVYPYESYFETSARPVLKRYNFVKLENNFIEVLICPDLGGKVYSLVEKKSGKECLYVPGAIRPSRILPRFSFVSGGIEVSFPISHTPTLNEKVSFEIGESEGRKYVSVGEKELRYGMQWTVEFSLGEGDHFLTQRAVFYNGTDKSHPWMSWSNAAVPAFEDSEFHFPSGEVLLHSDELKTIDWQTEGPKKNVEVPHMSGYFWKDPDVCAFGCYSPSRGIGLYHCADKRTVPGIKLWSYGAGRDVEWSYLSSLSKLSYVEIQAGPIPDQSMKYELKPGETHHHIEYWFPSCVPLDIDQLSAPNVSLRPLAEVPLFSFARKNEVDLWVQLKEGFEIDDISVIPDPPNSEKASWAPSGIHDLDDPFKWIIKHAPQPDKSLWQLHYGVWLAANQKLAEANKVLQSAKMDIAWVLLGRIHFYLKNFDKAKECYESMTDDALKLHPQIVIERDKLLEVFGEQTHKERMEWLDKLNALEDEMLIERLISLFIDQGRYQEAKQLLLTTHFQKFHQRYVRKGLWEKLCKKTNVDVLPYPGNLGEDNLAIFGKYREFDQS